MKVKSESEVTQWCQTLSKWTFAKNQYDDKLF